MKPLFMPDLILPDIEAISPSYLRENGIEVLILDIDNTLVTYGEAEPTERVIKWVDCMKREGFSLAVASNNEEERVARFCKPLGIFFVAKSRKPSRRGVAVCSEHFSTVPARCAVVGDQIFTDVLCAKRAGAHAILVTPLPYPENLFFKIKRFLEKPIIRRYHRKHSFRRKEKIS